MRFSDVAQDSGVLFQHHSPFTRERHLHLTMGSGIGWIDFDRNGFPDLYCAQGAAWSGASGLSEGSGGDRLFRNRGSGRFDDVSALVGLAQGAYSMGLGVADCDNDGFPDLYVTAFGPNRFYRNNGDGTFTETAALLGLDHTGYGASCTWADIDNDGDADLFVVNYLKFGERYPTCKSDVNGRKVYSACHPRYLEPEYDVLYRNEGDGTFTDVTMAAGLTQAPPRQGLGIIAADLDLDGDVDFYVANDSVPNQLWENLGDGTFAEQGLLSGTALNRSGEREAGMGVAAGDVDGNGFFDLMVTNYYNETNTLYRNEGNLLFLDVTDEIGLAAPSRVRLAFGVSFFDADGDGWLDCFVANGHVNDQLHLLGRDEPFEQPAQFFRNDGGKRFLDASKRAGPYFERKVVGRGSAVADYDRDGRPDLAVNHLNSQAVLLRNGTESSTEALRIELVGTTSQRDAIGAVIEVEAGDLRLVRARLGSSSYLSCDESQLLIGIGRQATADRVIVRWPGGQRESWRSLPTGTPLVLIEGTGATEPADD